MKRCIALYENWLFGSVRRLIYSVIVFVVAITSITLWIISTTSFTELKKSNENNNSIIEKIEKEFFSVLEYEERILASILMDSMITEDIGEMKLRTEFILSAGNIGQIIFFNKNGEYIFSENSSINNDLKDYLSEESFVDLENKKDTVSLLDAFVSFEIDNKYFRIVRRFGHMGYPSGYTVVDFDLAFINDVQLESKIEQSKHFSETKSKMSLVVSIALSLILENNLA